MIIGVVGFIGSGKGTVGDLLKTEFGFHSISFASHLKDVASLLFGWDRNLLEGDTDESRSFRERQHAVIYLENYLRNVFLNTKIKTNIPNTKDKILSCIIF